MQSPQKNLLSIAAAQSTSIAANIPANVAHHCAFVDAAAKHGVELLLFPELSLTGYELSMLSALKLRADDPYLQPLIVAAQEHQMMIVAGAALDVGLDLPEIASLIFMPSGKIEIYSKQFLHTGEHAYAVPGQDDLLLEYGNDRLAFAICADITQVMYAKNAASDGASLYLASVLLSPAGYENDVAYLKNYAQQFGFSVLMANHAGPTGGWVSAGGSAFWNAQGQEVIAAMHHDEALLILQRDQPTSEWKASLEHFGQYAV